MKIKSLILGSAAALLAVSGARAADAVMAPEPEPVDYVRVCDAYGSGFFYIPGTETCLSINGYVWFQVAAGSGTAPDLSVPLAGPFAGTLVNAGGEDTPGYYGNDTDGWRTGSRVRINFDARSETELGTLRGWMRLQADWNGSKIGDGPVAIDQAFIQLGGLVVGYGESAWFYQFNNSTLNYGTFTWGGLYYGYQERARISYEFGGKTGFYGVISLEDPADESSYMPDVVGRIGYGAAWGAVALTAAYDHDRNGDTVTTVPHIVYTPFGPVGVPGGTTGAGTDSALALSASALFNVPSMPGSAFKIIGYYNSADSNYGPGSMLNGLKIPGPIVAGLPTLTTLGQPEWSVLASFLYQATPNLGLIVSGQYFGDHYAAGTDDTVDDTSGWAAELEAVWTPVKNFEVRPTIAYTKAKELDGSVSGFLRFTRYF